MEYATFFTSLIALLMSLGSVYILQVRKKFVNAIFEIAAILKELSTLLIMISEAQADDKITQDELNRIVAQAKELQKKISAFKTWLDW